ncbi:hypothetical protein M9H77_16538 [Catharanthus roseus]|uniref:Uncharacterized protein n=1 Tax=Catharanthus roseus TaxID=4058 RepID=A0ACC0B216_CATRO|nr:hypothetical protein M9H77_16538 [Catharanthus roseus]
MTIAFPLSPQLSRHHPPPLRAPPLSNPSFFFFGFLLLCFLFSSPSLFREFYANIFFKSNLYKTDITTSIKGVWIQLNRAILAQIVGILDEGHSTFYEPTSMSIFADPNWVYSEALARFGDQAQAVERGLLNLMV